ncbi:MAG: hypothetical protein IJS66_00800 [Bacteroidales bacterium]|nr:hypothetical protein [Bacteroidales bacterium]
MNEVSRWLIAGAGVPEGLRLLAKYKPNKYVERLLGSQPGKYGWLLERVLRPFADSAVSRTAPGATVVRGFRERWPFLSDPACPMELKALAADKITAYHAYCAAHEKLFDCVTSEECFETAKKVIENYSENRLIEAEFAYYREHGSILGKHPVFRHSRKMDSYRKMGIIALVEEQRRLKGAIWRIESEIRKGDKPHLLSERQRRLAEKQKELDLVTGMIGNFPA